MWLHGVGIDVRPRHWFVAGSYSPTVPRDRCGWRGRMAASLAPGTGPAPPITYNFSPTLAATPAPRAVGIGASASHLSVKGSYSQASLTGTQPGGPRVGSSNPPNRYIFPFSTVTAAWWTARGIGFLSVHALPAGSYSYIMPAGLNPGRSPCEA